MRLFFFAMAWVAALPACAQAVADQFDRTSGERNLVYTADGSRDTRKAVFTFNAHFSGQAVAMGINLAFVSAGEDGAMPRSRFAGCHEVSWWIDGQPYAAARASHRGEIIDGEMIEMVEQEVTPEWVAAVGAAQSVRYRVCRDDHAFTPGDLHGFQIVAAKLKSAALSSSLPAQPGSTPAASREVEYRGMNWRPKHPGSMFGSGN